ncbi:MAG: hypothetical protein ACLU38_15665 [Dysosmobacter sp.]
MVSNPPTSRRRRGRVSPQETRSVARSEVVCTLEDVCRAAGWGWLRWGGRFCVVFPTERLAELMETARHFGLEPKRLRMVQHDAAGVPGLVLLECPPGWEAWSCGQSLRGLLLYDPDGRGAAGASPCLFFVRRSKSAMSRNSISGSHPPIGDLGDLSPVGADPAGGRLHRRRRHPCVHEAAEPFRHQKAAGQLPRAQPGRRRAGTFSGPAAGRGRLCAGDGRRDPAISDPGGDPVVRACAGKTASRCRPSPAAAPPCALWRCQGCPPGGSPLRDSSPANKRGGGRALTRLAAEAAHHGVPRGAPHKAAAHAGGYAGVLLGDRPAALCRGADQAPRGDHPHHPVRRCGAVPGEGATGEYVLVVAGARQEAPALTLAEGVAMVQSLRQQGQRMKDAVRRVAEDTGLSRNELYQAALQEE